MVLAGPPMYLLLLQMPLLDDPDLEAVAGQLEDPWQLSDSSDSGVSECKPPSFAY